VTDGGGGTFANIWTPNTYAQAGFYVSNTRTPGHVYQLSNEHHVRVEIKLDRVENWDINAPQTEGEAGESVAVGPNGNIYVANGQIFVYNPEGTQIARIDVPQRPINLIFGGDDGCTLYILAHHALYSVKARGPEQ
jgi:sugar lactone lactonase YvrE